LVSLAGMLEWFINRQYVRDFGERTWHCGNGKRTLSRQAVILSAMQREPDPTAARAVLIHPVLG